jgi:hypothetical protein
MAALAAIFIVGCAGTEPAPSLPRDLMRDLSSARIQPAPTSEVARLGELADGAGSTAALLLRSPARLTWSVRFREHAELDASVALIAGAASMPLHNPERPTYLAGVIVRIGISDDRAYEELWRLSLTAPGDRIAWQPVRLDLGSYSGWKWSLFYQPSRTTWNLIVAADPAPGGLVAWRTLRIQPR